MKILKLILLSTIFVGLSSCSSDFLDEEPKDFYNVDEGFENLEDFEASINNLYYLVREEYFSRDDHKPFDYIFGTDLYIDGEPAVSRHTNMSAAYDPTSDIVYTHWKAHYKIISETNLVLDHLSEADLDDEEVKEIEAKAKFFRGFAYRTLAYMYGGVPLTLKSYVDETKDDFKRSSKEEVLDQVIKDLKFASENLESLSDVADGEVSDVAALHLLSEVYLAADEPDSAVVYATNVINYPGMNLMTDRFGSRADEEPGDVYWDLFRKGNINHSNGNNETIWAIQFKTDVEGGGASTEGFSGSWPAERNHSPYVDLVSVGDDQPFLWPADDYSSGGRGVGWAAPTEHFSHEVWEGDWDSDIRNANHNFVREFPINDPSSSLYGDTISTENLPDNLTGQENRAIYPYQTKVLTVGNHPDELYEDKSTLELKSTAGGTYRNVYMFRLAETYLLRAEAYFDLGEINLAANDVNQVRSRSNASPVKPNELDLDYILDERMREFGIEEFRRLTLMRLGVLYDRVKEYNPYYEDVEKRYNLWPIPEKENEANDGHKLKQNPGY